MDAHGIWLHGDPLRPMEINGSHGMCKDFYRYALFSMGLHEYQSILTVGMATDLRCTLVSSCQCHPLMGKPHPFIGHDQALGI